MKTLVLFSVLFFASLFVSSQSRVTVDQSGNYVTMQSKSGRVSVKKDTGKYLIQKDGTKLPVYESANGKLFVEKTTKTTGKVYRAYLEIADNSAK